MCHSDYLKFFSEGYCPSGQSLLLNGRLVKSPNSSPVELATG